MAFGLLQNLKEEVSRKKQSRRTRISWNNLLEVGEGSLDIVLVVKTEAPGE